MVKSGTNAFSRTRTKNRSVCSAILTALDFLDSVSEFSNSFTISRPAAMSTARSKRHGRPILGVVTAVFRVTRVHIALLFAPTRTACQHVIPTSSYSSSVRFELASQSSPPVPDSRRRRKPFHIWFVPEDDRRRAMEDRVETVREVTVGGPSEAPGASSLGTESAYETRRTVFVAATEGGAALPPSEDGGEPAGSFVAVSVCWSFPSAGVVSWSDIIVECSSSFVTLLYCLDVRKSEV